LAFLPFPLDYQCSNTSGVFVLTGSPQSKIKRDPQTTKSISQRLDQKLIGVTFGRIVHPHELDSTKYHSFNANICQLMLLAIETQTEIHQDFQPRLTELYQAVETNYLFHVSHIEQETRKSISQIKS